MHAFRSTTSQRTADRFWRVLIATLESCLDETPATDEAGAAELVLSQEICAYPSHAGFLRSQGVQVSSFSPIRNRPPPEYQHHHDEFLEVPVLLEAVLVCERVLKALVSLK